VFSPTYLCLLQLVTTTLLSLRVSWGECRQRYAIAVRGFRTVEATRRMERSYLSRHITLWRSLKAPRPPGCPGERYGPGDALAGAIQSFSAYRQR
jgi:hypothetical protein